ncbi:MAG: hypothetical protein J6M53_08885 [Bacteroidaceae bacterium]|nr:hypothetical protein [Bacteroidaceae bacterium]
MGRTNYMRLVWIAAFAVFAGISCWATAESLHLLLNTWPIVMAYAVAIGFFIIASLGTKMIVDSLNRNIYLERRGARLMVGVVLLVVFWLGFSMPTNTHTFFYRTSINDMVTNDIAATTNYLGQIQGNTHNKAQAERKVKELENNVDVLLGSLMNEITNEANPGNGKKSKEILRHFAELLSVSKIEPLSYVGTSKQEREKICDAYRKMVYDLAAIKAQHIRAAVENPPADLLKDVKRDTEELDNIKKSVESGRLDLNDADDIKDICGRLNTAYNTVKAGRDFVNFQSKQDEAAYTAERPVTKVTRMLSVWHVWGDYIAGAFSGYGVGFWIIASILVDIAAFIFFDLAFRKTEE